MTSLSDKIRRYDNLHNEGGEGYNPYEDEAAEEYKAKVAVWRARQAQEDAEWTAEVTQQRRKVWNAAWLAEIAARPGRVGKALLAQIEQIKNVLGYGPDEVRRHVERHGLK